MRQQVFARMEKEPLAAPLEEHTGRLFTIACKQARLWMWESDYELDLNTPGDSVYNNGQHAPLVDTWARKQRVSAAVSNTLMDLAKTNDKGNRHPLRFVYPKYRHALAVYFLSCSFLFSPELVAVFPPGVLLDNGYGFSSNLSVITDSDKFNSMAKDPAQDMLGSISRMRNAHITLNAIPGTGKVYNSIIRRARESIAEIFSVMDIADTDHIVAKIDHTLQIRVDPAKIQQVPQLDNELTVTKLPKGDVAIYLSKYFSVAEVLNPNFWQRDEFNKLNVAIVGHRSFHSGAYLPSVPTVRTQRVIKGTIKRGTINTLVSSNAPGKPFVRPSDVFYASNPACASRRLRGRLSLLQQRTHDTFFETREADDELGMMSGQNILQTLYLGQFDDDAYATLFDNSDRTISQDSTEDGESSNDFYAAYADLFTFMATYERRQELASVLKGFLMETVMDGPSFNNGSGVYPVFRSLSEEGVSEYSETANDQIQYRVLTAYTASDFAVISGKEVQSIPVYSIIMNITTTDELKTHNEQIALLSHGSVATLLTRAAKAIPVKPTPISGLSNVTWENLPGNLEVVEGRLTIDPFVENRTGRTHEVRVSRDFAERLYDPLANPRVIQTVPFRCRAENTLIVNAQWPWKNGILAVQGRTPEPITHSAALALSTADYVLNDEKGALLFFSQARVDASYRDRSGFSWIVGRYLGVTGYNSATSVPVQSTWFLAREEELILTGAAGFAIQGADQWIPVDTFMPLVSGNSLSPVPSARITFVMT